MLIPAFGGSNSFQLGPWKLISKGLDNLGGTVRLDHRTELWRLKSLKRNERKSRANDVRPLLSFVTRCVSNTFVSWEMLRTLAPWRPGQASTTASVSGAFGPASFARQRPGRWPDMPWLSLTYYVISHPIIIRYLRQTFKKSICFIKLYLMLIIYSSCN